MQSASSVVCVEVTRFAQVFTTYSSIFSELYCVPLQVVLPSSRPKQNQQQQTILTTNLYTQAPDNNNNNKQTNKQTNKKAVAPRDMETSLKKQTVPIIVISEEWSPENR